MYDTINERFKRFFESLNISNIDFAKNVKAKPNEVTNWKAHTPINLDRLENILKFYKNLDARWLLTGDGNMYHEGMDISADPASNYKIKCNDPLCRLKIESLEREITLLEANLGDLRRKDNCFPGELEGGVEKREKTG